MQDHVIVMKCPQARGVLATVLDMPKLPSQGHCADQLRVPLRGQVGTSIGAQRWGKFIVTALLPAEAAAACSCSSLALLAAGGFSPSWPVPLWPLCLNASLPSLIESFGEVPSADPT
jgi:hypothetical protein